MPSDPIVWVVGHEWTCSSRPLYPICTRLHSPSQLPDRGPRCIAPGSSAAPDAFPPALSTCKLRSGPRQSSLGLFIKRQRTRSWQTPPIDGVLSRRSRPPSRMPWHPSHRARRARRPTWTDALPAGASAALPCPICSTTDALVRRAPGGNRGVSTLTSAHERPDAHLRAANIHARCSNGMLKRTARCGSVPLL